MFTPPAQAVEGAASARAMTPKARAWTDKKPFLEAKKADAATGKTASAP